MYIFFAPSSPPFPQYTIKIGDTVFRVSYLFTISSYYLAQKGLGRCKNSANEELRYAWSTASIVQFLAKPEYAGHTVNFRTRRDNFKSKKPTLLPQNEWLIFENTHEAIVKQEVWDLAQKLRETPRRTDTYGEANPLTGLLFCADCGAKLFNHRRTKTEHGKKSFADEYQCSTHKFNKAKFMQKCSAHYITTAAVREIILAVLRETSGYVREHEDEFVERVREFSVVRRGETAKSYKKQIAKNERRIAELDKIYSSLYQDKALGKISEERFAQMSETCEREQAELKSQTADLQAELDVFHADSENAEKFIGLAHRYTRFDELTTPMINEFIDKIIVHEGEWSKGKDPTTGKGRGTRSQQVDVYLKYIGNFDVSVAQASEVAEVA